MLDLAGGVVNDGHTPKQTLLRRSGWYDEDGKEIMVGLFDDSPYPEIRAGYESAETSPVYKVANNFHSSSRQGTRIDCGESKETLKRGVHVSNRLYEQDS